LCAALAAALKVRASDLPAGLEGPAIGEAMRRARIAAIAARRGESNESSESS